MKFTGKKDLVLSILVSHMHQVFLKRLVERAPAQIREVAIQVAKELASVEVEFSTRLRTTAGFARYGREPKIDLHYALLSGDIENLEKTYAHELGHLVAWLMFDERGHGKKWKLCMSLMKFEAEVKHNLDVRPWQRRLDKPGQAA